MLSNIFTNTQKGKSTMALKSLGFACVLALGATGSALALPPLGSDQHVHDQLLAGFIGDEIDRSCGSITARKLLALRKLYELRDYALAKGYSRAQVKAFVEDPQEKAKMKAEASQYLIAAGATPGEPKTYCAVGYAEISAKSLTGQLLRKN
ncbi:MAG: DUF5333 domain-containing protein [Paracoccaceae bacterium]